MCLWSVKGSTELQGESVLGGRTWTQCHSQARGVCVQLRGDQQGLGVFSGVVELGVKEGVPWLRVVLELWGGLCRFPSCHISGWG